MLPGKEYSRNRGWRSNGERSVGCAMNGVFWKLPEGTVSRKRIINCAHDDARSNKMRTWDWPLDCYHVKVNHEKPRRFHCWGRTVVLEFSNREGKTENIGYSLKSFCWKGDQRPISTAIPPWTSLILKRRPEKGDADWQGKRNSWNTLVKIGK